MISPHEESNVKSSPYNHGWFSGGFCRDYDRARDYQLINGKRSNMQVDQDKSIDLWIDLPFKNHEYPLQRQLHKKHNKPCDCCLASGGVILFRGRGKKSLGKTKGMKSYRWKDWQDEFNL